jgi:hypothetical protein
LAERSAVEGRVMWRWCAYMSGMVLIAVALAALPSGAIVESYVGGSAVHGHVEDGRYFVNPGHSWPVVEVSGSTWRAVYWLELLWPLSVVPGLIGVALMAYGMGPNWEPPPPPPKEPPPWVKRACIASGAFTVAGTWLFWVAVRVPWATILAGWVLFCVSAGPVGWLYTRSLRQQPTAGPPAPPSPARDSDPRSS